MHPQHPMLMVYLSNSHYHYHDDYHCQHLHIIVNLLHRFLLVILVM